MNNSIDLLYQQVQDLVNQVSLLKQQFDNFSPTLDDDEDLSSLVATLQTDLANCKAQVTSIQSNVNSLSNTYTQLVTKVEGNSSEINILKQMDDEIMSTVASLNVGVNSVQNMAINNQMHIDSLETNLSNHIEESSTYSSDIETLQKQTSSLQESIDNIEQGTTCDNELYFIVKGTYASPDHIQQIIDGTYIRSNL